MTEWDWLRRTRTRSTKLGAKVVDGYKFCWNVVGMYTVLLDGTDGI